MSVRDRLSSLFEPREQADLTSGEIARPLFYLSLPIVITNLLQTAYNLADTFWLGQYSTNALAAISFAFPLVFLLIALGLGVSVAGSVLVAQNTGAGNEREAEYAASQTVTFSLLAALGLGVAGYLLVEEFLSLLGASPAVRPLATSYMQVISLGMVFLFGFFVFLSLMRGAGDTVTPMLVMFGSVGVNVALDPFLIFGWGPFPRLGIAGAAVATVFARALALGVGLWIMLSGTRGIRIRPRYMVPDLAYATRIARIGLPASAESTVRALSVNLLLLVVATFPTTVVAAYGIGTRIFSVVFLPAIAVSQGVETMTGQNVGAGKPDRVMRTNRFASKAMFAVLAVLGVVAFVGAEPITAVFTTDPDVVTAGADFLRYVAPSFGFLGVMYAYTGGFRGTGRTMIAAVISVLTLGVVRLPIAWVAAGLMGPTGIWLSFTVSNVLGALVAYAWFRRGTWREGGLTGDRSVGASERDTEHGPAPGRADESDGGGRVDERAAGDR